MSEYPDARPPAALGPPTRTAEDLGLAIRRARRRLGLTQEELADHLGVPRPYLSQVESGKETVHVRRLLKTLAALGLDLYVVPRSRGRRPDA